MKCRFRGDGSGENGFIKIEINLVSPCDRSNYLGENIERNGGFEFAIARSTTMRK